jgi:hypothetical protein
MLTVRKERHESTYHLVVPGHLHLMYATLPNMHRCTARREHKETLVRIKELSHVSWVRFFHVVWCIRQEIDGSAVTYAVNICNGINGQFTSRILYLIWEQIMFYC